MFKSIALISMLAAGINAAPTPVELAPRASYTQFNGDGSQGAGWPTTNDWHSWDDLWNYNSGLMQSSCGNNGWGANNSPQEIADVGSAIQTVAGNNGIDSRVVLAIVMQESSGCVRVPTTISPDRTVTNPGLMQDHDGSGTCAGVNPCPSSEITQMIEDGVQGSQGYAALVASTGESGAQGYYAGARKYNSGSVDLQDLSQAYGANPNYASQIANRLLGWSN